MQGSEDYWDTCPRCWAKAVKEAELLDEKVIATFGKIGISEWEALREDSKKGPQSNERMRVYQDTYMEDSGAVFISINWACAYPGCGFEHEFKHTEQADVGVFA